jgi:ubiquinone/menaquinone biosynthesis C-methylase UbiE
MVRALSGSGPAEFDAVDASGDPGALIGFLDAAKSVTGLGEAKGRLLEQLALGQARAALDVGCGAGTDLAAMAQRMPSGAQVSGIDASQTMIAEARRRTADLGAQVSLRVGQATDLPYPDNAFDACLADTVLQHVPDPARVVSEMARVTRPGGRVAALEFDLGTTFLDHPDTQTTQMILDTFTDAAVQGRIGRQVPRLFRLAGLADVSVTPTAILGNAAFWRILYQDHVDQLVDQGLLTVQDASQWWAGLEGPAQAGSFLGGAVTFLTAATKRAGSATATACCQE